jgi:hypothetical protein
VARRARGTGSAGASFRPRRGARSVLQWLHERVLRFRHCRCDAAGPVAHDASSGGHARTPPAIGGAAANAAGAVVGWGRIHAALRRAAGPGTRRFRPADRGALARREPGAGTANARSGRVHAAVSWNGDAGCGARRGASDSAPAAHRLIVAPRTVDQDARSATVGVRAAATRASGSTASGGPRPVGRRWQRVHLGVRALGDRVVAKRVRGDASRAASSDATIGTASAAARAVIVRASASRPAGSR